VSNLFRVEIRLFKSRLINQIDEISTEQISLKIIDILKRLNIANKIEKNKTKDQQFKSLKYSSSRLIKSSDLNFANIIESKKKSKILS
jgi:hypothetical protein